MSVNVSMTLNGNAVSAEVEGRTLLVSLLRDQLGLTGTHEEIATAAASLGIFYEAQEVGDQVFYDHTASVTVLDGEGHLRMVWPFGVKTDEIAQDLNYFVRER